MTKQLNIWSKIGTAYTDANPYSPESRIKDRPKFFQYFDALDVTAKILEVGCNNGTNLGVLANMGFKNLFGVDILPYALSLAGQNVANATLCQGSALDLPFEDGSFDAVFTCGVLIHIHPNDITTALKEIHRCSNKFIFGLEDYTPEYREIEFRASNSRWATDFASLYIKAHKGSELIHSMVLDEFPGRSYDMGIFSIDKSPKVNF